MQSEVSTSSCWTEVGRWVERESRKQNKLWSCSSRVCLETRISTSCPSGQVTEKCSLKVKSTTRTVCPVRSVRFKSMDADLGGTEIYNPLQKICKTKAFPGYPKQIFLLTDGDVSDTEGVIALVGR
jgi:hypothetical protein